MNVLWIWDRLRQRPSPKLRPGLKSCKYKNNLTLIQIYLIGNAQNKFAIQSINAHPGLSIILV